MKYMILVSHGNFAAGLHNALEMLTGKREDVLSIGLQDGISANKFAEMFSEEIASINENDDIILLGDIVGGSPLTTAMNAIYEKGMLEKTVVLGGMNLPLCLTTVLMKDSLEGNALIETALSEATGSIKQCTVVNEADEDI